MASDQKNLIPSRARSPPDLNMDSFPGPLGQVVTNLINNALIHGFEGRAHGIVSVRGKAIGKAWVELTVQDNGIGIPTDNLKRIYDPFFTTKLGAGGSGLGLNITHNIVTGLLGGKINVQSELGKGTTFTLILPCVAPIVHNEDKVDHPFDLDLSARGLLPVQNGEVKTDHSTDS